MVKVKVVIIKNKELKQIAISVKQRKIALKAKKLLICLASHINKKGEEQPCEGCSQEKLCGKVWRLSQE